MMLMQIDVPFWPDDDSRHLFDRFLDQNFIKYKGCLIVKTASGFTWNDSEYPDLSGAYAAVDRAVLRLADSTKLRQVDVTIYSKEGREIVLADELKSGYLTGKSPWEMYRDNQNQ